VSKYISVNILFIVIISATISCADDIPATTEDGRGVILHDDGTWGFNNYAKPFELKDPEQAKEFIKKTEIPSVEDLGWNVYPKEDGFEVERILLKRHKMKSKYRWHVYKSGKVKPLNNKAIGITKE